VDAAFEVSSTPACGGWIGVTVLAAVNAATFSALGEPSRLRIVEALRDGPLPVGAIVERLGIGQPQTSKHLRVLGEAGIVQFDVRHRYRIYRLRSEPFDAVAGWVRSFEQLWVARLDSLGAFLDTLDPERNTDAETNW
jgi:DNA-binding transcriptional ArsR family regulator